MFLRFAYVHLLYILLPVYVIVLLYRWFFYKYPVYTFPLSKLLLEKNIAKKTYHKPFLFLLRSFALLGLIFLVARPQWVDENSKVNIEGIEIALAIDVSGSMQCFDDQKDQRTRIDVAKQEAIHFIEKRTDDPIGVVIFAKDAVSQCPLTLDKKMLKEIVGGITLGMIDHTATSLGTGLATAVNRLRNSQAKSKIIILLTDGAPTPGEKIDPETAMDLAKKFGVKVYTIAIGNPKGGFLHHPFHGIIRTEDSINEALLEKIASTTGGMFFRARNPKDMRTIYDKIDRLEKTEYQTDVFHRYYEAFLTLLWIVVALIGLECVLRLFFWRGV